MTNRKIIFGAAIVIGGLAVLGMSMKKKSSKKKFLKQAEEAKGNFKSKLNELQRKAKKEYKNSEGDVKDAVNSAKERANEWVNRANA
ncbi:MAG: hypothetical protein EOO45_03790 [Flavobacterium sp.]|nr:MAG: hypothetical protein EOO45_03790 [Flavobacterium sp.]